MELKTTVIGPNPDIIRLTEKIVEQNQIILEMNAKLLHALSAPMVMADPCGLDS